jgi:hypothetical protein
MSMFRLIIISIFMSCSAGASLPIQGGEPVADSDPVAHFTVALGHSESDQRNICTAVLISRSRAITAGHCIHEGMTDYVLRFGIDANAPTAERRIWKTLVHPDYSSENLRQSSDIAILYFDGGLPTGYFPARLFMNDEDLTVGASIQFAGYGRTHNNELYKVSLPLKSVTENILEFENSASGGPCSGDSGGPAVFTYRNVAYVVGIDQAGSFDRNGCEGWLGYTRVDVNIPWLDQN